MKTVLPLVLLIALSSSLPVAINYNSKPNKDQHLIECGVAYPQNASMFQCHHPYCDCSNNGECVNGQCVCDQGYYGIRCEIPSTVKTLLT